MLIKQLRGYSISEVMDMLEGYRETVIEGFEGWSREIEAYNLTLTQQHDWNVENGGSEEMS